MVQEWPTFKAIHSKKYFIADPKVATRASDRLNDRMEKSKNAPRVIQFPPDLIQLDSDYKTEIKAVVTQVLNGPGLFVIKFTAMYEKLFYYGIMRMGKVTNYRYPYRNI